MELRKRAVPKGFREGLFSIPVGRIHRRSPSTVDPWSLVSLVRRVSESDHSLVVHVRELSADAQCDYELLVGEDVLLACCIVGLGSVWAWVAPPEFSPASPPPLPSLQPIVDAPIALPARRPMSAQAMLEARETRRFEAHLRQIADLVDRVLHVSDDRLKRYQAQLPQLFRSFRALVGQDVRELTLLKATLERIETDP